MVESNPNEVLNQVLVNVSRSLLQYVGECWPFTTRDEAERTLVAACVNRQRDGVQRLATLLTERVWPTDYGAYPTEYTDLHFVELDYLLPQVIDGERSLVTDLERAIERCSGDAEVVEVLRGMLSEQASIVGDLEGLVASRTAA